MMDEISSEIINEMSDMIRQVQSLAKDAVLLIEPQVNQVIRSRVTDSKQIEVLLDKLVDYAGMDQKGLILFKRLCRYYFYIDPESTAEYIDIYRDLYDSVDDLGN